MNHNILLTFDNETLWCGFVVRTNGLRLRFACHRRSSMRWDAMAIPHSFLMELHDVEPTIKCVYFIDSGGIVTKRC
jgi:hypothetical protein